MNKVVKDTTILESASVNRTYIAVKRFIGIFCYVILFSCFGSMSGNHPLDPDHPRRLNLRKDILPVLVERVNACIQRAENGESTDFNSVSGILKTYHPKSTLVSSYYWWRFVIRPSHSKTLGGDTCFAARAIPIMNRSDTWFEIQYDAKTDKKIQTCGDSEAYGCFADKDLTIEQEPGKPGYW